MPNQVFTFTSNINSIIPIPQGALKPVDIKFDIVAVAQSPKPPAPLRLALTGTNEIAVSVLDEKGNIKYSLLGIRPDGTFMSYSVNNAQKKKDGFKVNDIGQIVFYGDATA